MNNKTYKRILAFSVISLVIISISLWIPLTQNLFLKLGSNILGRDLRDPEKWIRIIHEVSLLIFELPIIISLIYFKDYLLRLKNFYNYFVIFWIIILSLSITTFLSSFPTHFWNNTDSYVFQYIGHQMHNGLVPYRDMFDHKGPFLYFIQWFWSFWGNGIFFSELINLLITCIIFYQICKLIEESKIICLISVTFILFCYSNKLFESGNLTEEYALPCIAFSLYIFLKSLKNNDYSFWGYFIFGLTFSITILLQVNLVAPWIVFTAYLFFSLLFEKQYKTLIKIIIAFFTGVLLVIGLTIIYLIITNSLHEMWNCYILFNLKYCSKNNLKLILQVFKLFILCFLIPIICFIITFKQYLKNKLYITNFAAFIISLFFTVISGRTFLHYGIVLLPFFLIPVTYTISLVNYKVLSKNNYINIIVSVFIFYSFTAAFTYQLVKNIKMEKQENVIVNYLKDKTKQDDDVLVLGNDCFFYVESERFTKQKFFYQTPIFVNNKFIKELENNILSSPPAVIIIPEYRIKQFMDNEKLNNLFNFINLNYKKIELLNDNSSSINYNIAIIFEKKF